MAVGEPVELAEAVKKAAKGTAVSTSAQRGARLALLRSTMRAVQAANKARPAVKPECEEIVSWMEDEQKKSIQILQAKLDRYEKRPLLTTVISTAKSLYWVVRTMYSLCSFANLQRLAFVAVAVAYAMERYGISAEALAAGCASWIQEKVGFTFETKMPEPDPVPEPPKSPEMFKFWFPFGVISGLFTWMPWLGPPNLNGYAHHG